MAAYKRPRVSVVVPGKDVEDYIADTLTSLTRQMADSRELEVVVVNDGSADSTGSIVASFSSRLPNLHVLTNETPSGLASARNKGLAATTAEYVVYLDADDWLATGHLSHLVDAMDALRVDFLRTDHTTVNGRVRHLRRAPQARRGVVLDPRESILPADNTTMVDYPYAWAGIFDRALAKDGLLSFPDGLHTAEDRSWIWRLFLQARSYAVVDSPGICYRRGIAGSLTGSYDRRQLDILRALRLSLDLVEADSEAQRFLPKFTRMTFALIAHHVTRSRERAPQLNRALRRGARELFASIPGDVLAEEARQMDRRRSQALRDLLPRLPHRDLEPIG